MKINKIIRIFLFGMFFWSIVPIHAQDCEYDSVFFQEKTLKAIIRHNDFGELGIERFRVLQDDKRLNIVGVLLLLDNHENAILIKIKPLESNRILGKKIRDCDVISDLPNEILRRKVESQQYCVWPWTFE